MNMFFQIFVLDYRNVYGANRASPPISAHVPLISGQMMWISMIKEKIETPMNFLLVKF